MKKVSIRLANNFGLTFIHDLFTTSTHFFFIFLVPHIFSFSCVANARRIWFFLNGSFCCHFNVCLLFACQQNDGELREKSRKLSSHIVWWIKKWQREQNYERGKREIHEMNRMRPQPKKINWHSKRIEKQRKHCNHDVVIHIGHSLKSKSLVRLGELLCWAHNLIRHDSLNVKPLAQWRFMMIVAKNRKRTGMENKKRVKSIWNLVANSRLFNFPSTSHIWLYILLAILLHYRAPWKHENCAP